MISLHDYLTASGKYPDRETRAQQDLTLIPNATRLLSLINPYLEQLGLSNVKVSSGYRPPEVNAKTAGSAKHSLHMSCLAVDLEDFDGSIDELMQTPEACELRKKLGLWLESPASTPNWSHLDCGVRADRPSREFIP